MERAAVPSIVREERLKAWIDAYLGPVRRTCYACLMDRSLAEDAAQDTFLKAWKHMADYERKNIENDKAWLMRIAINTCRDYKRSSWFRHVDRRVSADALLETRTGDDPSDRALTLDIMNLPDKYKGAVLLYFYHGLTLQETAKALGLPLSTMHRRIEQAKERLKKDWMGGESDEG